MDSNFNVREEDLIPKSVSIPEKIREIALSLLQSNKDMVELIDDTNHYSSPEGLRQGAITALSKNRANPIRDICIKEGVRISVEIANKRVFIVARPYDWR